MPLIVNNLDATPLLLLFYLKDGGNREALRIQRDPKGVTDTATVYWERWAAHLGAPKSSASFVKLMGLARKHLRASDAVAALDVRGKTSGNGVVRGKTSGNGVVSKLLTNEFR
jgi:hypothetical protein